MYVINGILLLLSLIVMPDMTFKIVDSADSSFGGSVSSSSSMAEGILLIRGNFAHVTLKYAEDINLAVKSVISIPRYSWLSPELLVGLAINESDLRSNNISGYDCGITQVRTIVKYRNRKKAASYCRRLVKSIKLSFRDTAEELTEIRNRYCKYLWLRYSKQPKSMRAESKFRRCVLNVYNQGPRYYKIESCSLDNRRCRVISRYWVRVSCFAVAVKLGSKPRWRCRSLMSDRSILNAFRLKKLPHVFFRVRKEGN